MLVPILFGWWLFVPMAILFVYLAKVPYEVIVVGNILDAVYYFGDGFLVKYQLTIFALVLILVALFLNNRIHWSKTI